LTTELIERAQPGIKTIRTVVRSVQERPALWKALLLSPIVIGGITCVAIGAVTGALAQRARHRARLRHFALGRFLLAVTD